MEGLILISAADRYSDVTLMVFCHIINPLWFVDDKTPIILTCNMHKQWLHGWRHFSTWYSQLFSEKNHSSSFSNWYLGNAINWNLKAVYLYDVRKVGSCSLVKVPLMQIVTFHEKKYKVFLCQIVDMLVAHVLNYMNSPFYPSLALQNFQPAISLFGMIDSIIA